MRRGARIFGSAGVWAVVAMAAWAAVAGAAGGRKRATVPREVVEGRDLFERIWAPGEPGPGGGDGLGPLYNAGSCAACHHQGGPGGSGSNAFNVVILTAAGRADVTCGPTAFQGEPEDLHPGFRNGRTGVVLHRFATGAADKARLDAIGRTPAIQTRDELIGLRRSERNTPALFGAGRIDGISEKAILDAAARKFEAFPEIKGRASVLKGGRVGRFGWKGQTATLRDFVVLACANELGLEVPGQHQPSLVPMKEFDGSKLKLDLDANGVERLTAYVGGLPRPAVRPIDPASPFRGRAVFEAIGCATCHAPRLGNVDGLYSDLLLHDLGDRLLDVSGGYGAPVRSSVVDVARGDGSSRPASGEAGPTEWRTPPLWGVAHSAPYLHDGRARTLDEAIRLHGGEADATTKRYGSLDFGDRQAVVAFLRSLVAPAQPGKSRPSLAPPQLSATQPRPACGAICCFF